eukprot:g6469.t1
MMAAAAAGAAGGGLVREGQIVVVRGGKYDGEQGTVVSVASKTCRLRVKGEVTGNIQLSAVASIKSSSSSSSSSTTTTTTSMVGAASSNSAAGSDTRVLLSDDDSGDGSSDDRKGDDHASRVFALAIGASQDPSEDAMKMAASADVDLREARYHPRRLALRGSNALPDVIDDVVAVKEWLEETAEVAEVKRFVGRDDTNSLTRRAFLNKVDKLLAQPGKVFVLYYAGHGTGGGSSDDGGGGGGGGDYDDDDAAPGAFCMQKDGYVTMDDLINAWVGAQVTARRGQRFVIVADSCHSGALVDYLREKHRERRREGLPNLNMAVQSACGAAELSTGGLFTQSFLEQQQRKRFSGKSGGFDWAGCVPEPTACTKCRKFFQSSCSNCRKMRDDGYPVTVEEVQHPTYFATFGGSSVEEGRFKLRFYARDVARGGGGGGGGGARR